MKKPKYILTKLKDKFNLTEKEASVQLESINYIHDVRGYTPDSFASGFRMNYVTVNGNKLYTSEIYEHYKDADGSTLLQTDGAAYKLQKVQ